MASDLPLADELSAVVARAAGLLLTEESVGDALAQLARAIRDAMPGTLGAGVTLIDARGRKTSTASTDRLVEEADRLQYELGEGPCLTAWAQGRPVRIDDTRSETRWPRWSAAAQDLRILSCLSTPLITPTGVIGALKVYSPEPSAYDRDSEQLLARLTAPAAVILGNLQARDAAARLSEDLQEALNQRDLINTAKGMLMESLNIGSEEARTIMIVTAQGRKQPLHAVAAELIDDHPDRIL